MLNYGTQLYDASECIMEQIYQRGAPEETIYAIPQWAVQMLLVFLDL